MRIEEQEQIAVANFLRTNYPDVIFTTAPQGNKVRIGVAVKQKRMGYLAGTPDLMIFEPRLGYFGLFIEMKKNKIWGSSTVSKIQKDFHTRLRDKGYCVTVCYGIPEAEDLIKRYMTEPVTVAYDNKLMKTIPTIKRDCYYLIGDSGLK